MKAYGIRYIPTGRIGRIWIRKQAASCAMFWKNKLNVKAGIPVKYELVELEVTEVTN